MHIQRQILVWLSNYVMESGQEGFVVGVSGGVDSAVVSTLCCQSGWPTKLVSMPILQSPDQLIRANQHIDWLCGRYPNAERIDCDLTESFTSIESTLVDQLGQNAQNDLAFANTRSRLRMLTLYHIAQCHRSLVVGTGNRVEDFGVGFFTKYGDGGVDLSPIADLYKSEVRDLAAYLGIADEIVNAAPTDGLWSDGRTDEDQLGATYAELEKVMQCVEPVTERDHQVCEIYNRHRLRNQHKMKPIPVCVINRSSI